MAENRRSGALANHLAKVQEIADSHGGKLHGAALESHLEYLRKIGEAHELHGAALKSHVAKVAKEHQELHGAALASHLAHVKELADERHRKLYGAALESHEKKLAEEAAK